MAQGKVPPEQLVYLRFIDKNGRPRCLFVMRKKAALWTTLALVGVLVLFYISYGLTHPARARAQRIGGVNSVRSVSMTLARTNASPNTVPGSGQ
jgi:hypothetical protein